MHYLAALEKLKKGSKLYLECQSNPSIFHQDLREELKDRIVLTSKNGNTKIKDILDGNISDDNENTWSEKAIIFNNIPTNRVSGFLDGLKKMKIRRPLTAMVTEVSIDWKLDTLIYNLKEERKSIAKGQVVDHSK